MKKEENIECKVMSIEIKFQTIVIQTDQIQEQLFGLAFELGRNYSSPKKRKRRKRIPKITIGDLIQEIIDDVEKRQIYSE